MRLFSFLAIFFIMIICNAAFVVIAWGFPEDTNTFSPIVAMALSYGVLGLSLSSILQRNFNKWKNELERDSKIRGADELVNLIGERSADKQFYNDVSIKSVPIRDYEGKNVGSTTVYQEVLRKKEEYCKKLDK